jgi:hypothetical protein
MPGTVGKPLRHFIIGAVDHTESNAMKWRRQV